MPPSLTPTLTHFLRIAAVLVCLGTNSPAWSETVADRKAAVLNDRAAMENDARWIYNDFDRGFAAGRRTGKPVLIVLRCIPCLACAGIDARVLLDKSELNPLLDQFVCVRVINANALDLSRFQFDFDLSFSTLLFNGDGTLYGRYGSWQHQKDPKEKAIDGFKKALESALVLHAQYPANKPSLAGKQPHPTEFKTPVELPTLQGKYTRTLDWQGKVVQSCVHCHQIGDAFRELERSKKQSLSLPLIYPFPAPETIGISLTQDSETHIRSILSNSPAERAGLLPGDELIRVQSQPVISNADVSWILHHTPENASLETVFRRGGEEKTVRIVLPSDWRLHSDISRRVGTWQMRAMALGGMFLEELPESERASKGLAPDQLALVAKHVGEYGEHAAAKKAGFKKGDILVEIAGKSSRTSESELIGRLLQQFKPRDQVRTTVLRPTGLSTERLELSYPIQ